MEPALYIGLMSGTSVDGIDSALIRCAADSIELVATHLHPIPAGVRALIEAISHPGDDEIERLGPLDRELGRLFAAAALALADQAAVDPGEVRAIGSHGQTVRHRPPCDSRQAADCFTLQLADPNTIAELTGITTVADFRRRDIAAGGEGAPLAPAFHAAAFARPGVNRAIVNIGGIANVSLLEGRELRMGFDTGPGNTLLDGWVRRHRQQAYDADGRWAGAGVVDGDLLQALLAHPYFARSGPRSSGKEAFNLAWLDEQLQGHRDLAAVDVQATLAELTAVSIARAVAASSPAVAELYVCGGGAHNSHLMARLAQLLPGARVATTEALGIDPDWVEAMTFAWLAQRTLAGMAGNAPAVTGAAGERVLGGIYPATGIRG